MYAIKIQVFQTSELELFLNTSVQIAEYPHRGKWEYNCERRCDCIVIVLHMQELRMLDSKTI